MEITLEQLALTRINRNESSYDLCMDDRTWTDEEDKIEYFKEYQRYISDFE